MAQMNDFTTGSDFISFGSPPPDQPEAGPSRPQASSSNIQSKSGAPPTGPRHAGRAAGRAALDSDDEDLMAAKEGRGAAGRLNGKGKGKVAEKRGRSPPTGPRSLKEKKAAAERNAPWTDSVDWEGCRDPAEMLNLEIDAYYRYVSPTKEEFEVRLLMIELITRAVHAVWPNAEVTPFGSWQTQLYLPSGDIDLVVSTDKLNDSNKVRLLTELSRAMRQARITDVVAIIAKARVPIIKFVTLEGHLNVDISLNQTNGISAGKIINEYLEVLPGARQLIMVVKAFLSQRSMNEVFTGGLGSYSVICLVLSFLQVHPKLRRGEIDPEKNLGTLLMEFFELYGRNFHYDEVGISLRRGGSYYTKRSRGWSRPGQPYLLSIEDPQDPNNDISGGSYGIRQVKNTLAGAFDMLQGRLFERAMQITKRRTGEDDGDWEPEEMSILTGVMGVTKKSTKHRQELRTLHRERRLQKLLDMPPGADPSKFVQHYRPPPVIGAKRPRRGSPPSQSRSIEPVTPASAAKRRKGLTGAVMVDDTEVLDLVNDNESDEFEMEIESDDEAEEADINTSLFAQGPSSSRGNSQRPSGKKAGSELTEVVPDGRGGYESVSHDSDDLEERDVNNSTVKGANGRSEEEEEESRYGVGQKKKQRKKRLTAAAKRAAAAAAAAAAKNGNSDSSSDDSSIIAIDAPKTKGKGNASNKPEQGEGPIGGGPAQPAGKKRKMSNQQKRDFWASKGRVDPSPGSSDDDASFDTGADFVGLDLTPHMPTMH